MPLSRITPPIQRQRRDVYKYTGARGKSGTSDACAEMVSYLTRLLEKNNIVWQIGEMEAKLDLGGGGTVAVR